MIDHLGIEALARAFGLALRMCAREVFPCGRIHDTARISALSTGLIVSEPIGYNDS